MAARAIKLLNEHLKPSLQTAGEDELYHRGQCQLAAWMSIFGALNTRFGISHALGTSDWTDVGRAAWLHLVHHLAARDALHGGNFARALRSDRRGIRNPLR